MRFGALLLLTCALSVWSTSAKACSCGGGSEDLVTNLREARDGADAIFHARVVSVDPLGGFLGVFGWHRPEATLEVLESFKGHVGSKLVLSAGGGSCEFPFKADGEYLVYASREDGEWAVPPCSRSRTITRDDVELEWLRTGRPPLVPVALQRETVRCETCDLETVARTLVGTTPGAPHDPRLWKDDEAVKALREARPFWTGGYYNHEDPSRSTAVGLSSDLRPFELLQTPDSGTEKLCQQRVSLRWCERLEAPPGASHPALRCVNPGPPQELCDETKSRTASWEPKERIEAASCYWGRPDRPRCELQKEPRPLAAGAPASPLLVCEPGYNGSSSAAHSCRVVPANASP